MIVGYVKHNYSWEPLTLAFELKSISTRLLVTTDLGFRGDWPKSRGNILEESLACAISQRDSEAQAH
jgi:hypothetical protein